MDIPRYVLRAQEGMLVPKNNNRVFSIVKNALWVLIALIVLGSLIFKSNLFSSLPWSARIALIISAITVFSLGGSKRIPSPLEIRFYDDYLVVHCDKQYYSRKTSRMEDFRFNYKDIKRCDFDKTRRRMNIRGYVEATWYNYNRDGSLPVTPSKQRTADSLCFFYLMEENPYAFISEFENYSSHEVKIVD